MLSEGGKALAPEVYALLSPHGERVLFGRRLTGEPSPRATVFDVVTGRHHDLEVPVGVSLSSAAWSPDGKVVAFASDDRRAGSSSVLRVDAPTGKQIENTLAVENSTFTSIAFTQSGRRIVALARTPDGPGTIRMWDADGLLPIGDPIPVDPYFGSLQVNDEGTALGLQFDVSDPQNWVPVNMAVFDLTPKAWVRTACNVAGRTFTRYEWGKLLPDRPYDPGCR